VMLKTTGQAAKAVWVGDLEAQQFHAWLAPGWEAR
jgi:hypothetical protein